MVSKQRKFSLFKKSLFGLLLLLVLLVLSAVLFLHTSAAANLLLRIVNQKLNTTAGFTLSAGKVVLNPLSLTVVLEDAVLRPLPGEISPLRIFRAKKVLLSTTWPTLMGKVIHLRKVCFTEPFLDLNWQKESDIQVSQEPQAQITSSIPRIQIDDFQLTAGRLTNMAPEQSVVLKLLGIEAGFNYLDLENSHRGYLKAASGQASLKDKTWLLHELEMRAGFDGSELSLDTFLLESGLSRISAFGTITLSTPQIQYHLNALTLLQASEFKAFIADDYDMSGMVQLNLNIDGQGSDFRYRGDLSSNDLLIPNLGHTSGKLDFSGNRMGITLQKLSWKSSEGEISGDGFFSLLNSPSALKLRWQKINLDGLNDLFPNASLQLTGKSQGEVEARWTRPDFSDLDAKATFFLQAQPGFSPSGHIELTVKNKTLAAKGKLSLAGIHLDLTAKGNLAKVLKVESSFNVPDIWQSINHLPFRNDIYSALPAVLHPLPEKGGQINGRIALQINPGKPDLSPIWNFDVVLEPGNLGGMQLDRIILAGNLDQQGLSLDKVALESRNGQLHGQASYHPGKSTFQASLQGKGINLGSVTHLIPVPKGLTGLANFDFTGQGTMNKPGFNLNIKIIDLKTDQMHLPEIDFQADSDGNEGSAVLTLPALKLHCQARLPFIKPYLLTGSLMIEELPTARLLTLLSPVHEAPAPVKPGHFSTHFNFSLPLFEPSLFRADGLIILRDEGVLLSRIPSWPGDIPTFLDFQGRIVLKGDPRTPQNLAVDLQIEQFQLSTPNIEFNMQNQALVQYAQGRIGLDKLQISSDHSKGELSGWLNLNGEPSFDTTLNLDVDLAQLDPFIQMARINGHFKLSVDAKGLISAPSLRGKATFTDLSAHFQDYPLQLNNINGNINFIGPQAVLSDFQGIANNGPFTLEGAFEPQGISSDEGIRLRINSFLFNYPEGAQTLSDAVLSMRGGWQDLELRGEINLRSGSYRRDIHPGVELISLIRNRPEPILEEYPHFLTNMKLALSLTTSAPFQIHNNLAEVGIEGNLALTGTPIFPILSGRLRNNGLGKAVFGNRHYTLETITIEYPGTNPWDFNLNLIALTQLRDGLENLDVRLQISGQVLNPTFTLSSDPARSSYDLSFLLLTGKTSDKIQGGALDILGGQMLQHFATPLVSPLTEGIKSLLKAEDVSLEPLNIASEEDPGARFTIRKRITDRAAVTYSVDITRSQRQTWILDYDLSRSFSLSTFRKDDGTYGGSVNHTVTLGKVRPTSQLKNPSSTPQTLIKAIDFQGDPMIHPTILKSLGKRLKPGSPLFYSALYDSVDKITNHYKKQGYLDAVVTPKLIPTENNQVKVSINIRSGKPTQFTFPKESIPTRLLKKINKSWSGNLPESANLLETRLIILKDLHRMRHYKAQVSLQRAEDGSENQIRVSIQKGPRYRITSFKLISENSPLKENEVIKTLSRYPLSPSNSLWNLIVEPNTAINILKSRLNERGYLSPIIGDPVFDVAENADTITIRMKLDAGPFSQIRNLILEGDAPFPKEKLTSILKMRAGAPYNPARLQEERNTLISFFRSQGYPDAKVSARALKTDDKQNVDITYTIDTLKKATVGSIRIVGNHRTQTKLILRKAALTPGALINPENFAKSQKRLYETGLFGSVSIDRVKADTGMDVAEEVVITVEESPPLKLTYGLRYNTEEKLEGYANVSYHNLLGGGRRGSLNFRENARQSDLRFSVNSPTFLGVHLDTLFSIFRQKEIRDTFVSEMYGASIQQSIKLPYDFTLSFAYRLNRIHSYELESDGPFAFDNTILLSETVLNLIQDTRNDRFNPTKGSYFSASFSYAPKFLGSELPYISLFTQYSRSWSLFGKSIWSSGIRLGLADAFAERLISNRRFFAGGGYSIRGFELDSLGPIDPYLDKAEGGEAVLIINNEFRLPIISRLGMALFYDFGNVYATVKEFNLRDIRHSAGLGLRFDSPIGLLRLDLGYNLFPRNNEPQMVWFFGIGQAF